MGRQRLLAALAFLLFPLSACAAVATPPRLDIAPRGPDAMSGSAFAAAIESLSLEDRSLRVLEELRAGNVPDHLRELVPVELRRRTLTGRSSTATVFASRDYLAIGSDDDFFRIPVNLYTATAFCREVGCVLPTAKIVDAIHDQAAVRLKPFPMKPGQEMRSIDYYQRHNREIERQLEGLDRSGLLAGHKKDLVLTPKLTPRRRKVAIYGWHRRRGDPIQPVSTIHVAAYADYSHGLRLVHERVLVDGEERSIYDVLADPGLSKLLSRSGPMPDARAIMGFPAR